MRKLYSLIALSAISFFNAQTKIGLNAGHAFLYTRSEVHNVLNKERLNGFYAGVFSEFNVSEQVNIATGVNYLNASNLDFLSVPVLLKWYFVPKVNINVGPQLMWTLKNVPSGVKNFNFGMSGGVGFECAKDLTIEAKYTYQTNDYLKDSSRSTNSTINYLTVGLAYNFLK
jgi:opacity protein-like surface antigen